MIVRESRSRPPRWQERRKTIPAWSVPFFAVEWIFEWLAYLLSKWHFVVVLEYLGSLSILVAVFFYFYEADSRVKQRHYQAWQVINTAQGKGGSGGRLEALQELNEDHVPLVGVDVSGAFLQGIRLDKARLLRSDFSAADVRNSHFEDADLQDSDLHSANFRQSSFQRASLARVRLDDADLSDANFTDADLSGATFDNADLGSVAIAKANWNQIRSLKGANVYGIQNAPDFVNWALTHGAVQLKEDDWEAARSKR